MQKKASVKSFDSAELLKGIDIKQFDLTMDGTSFNLQE